MGQSIGSVGNSHKQKGVSDQKHGQHETAPGQKVADQGGPKAGGKLDGGADHGARSTR